MITTGSEVLDAMLAELEAHLLGILEANVTKAGEIARLKALSQSLEGERAKLQGELQEAQLELQVRQGQLEKLLLPLQSQQLELP